jgi:hypothetical protein
MVVIGYQCPISEGFREAVFCRSVRILEDFRKYPQEILMRSSGLLRILENILMRSSKL